MVEMVDEKLAAGLLDGYQYADMPDDRDTWRLVLAGLDEVAQNRYGQPAFASAEVETQEAIVGLLAAGPALGRRLGQAQLQTGVVGVHAHGPGCVLLPPLGVERDRLRRPRLPPGLHAARAHQHQGTVRAVWGH